MLLEEEDIHTDKMRISKGRKEDQEMLCIEVLNPLVSFWNSVFHYLMLLNPIQETVCSRRSSWDQREKGSNGSKKKKLNGWAVQILHDAFLLECERGCQWFILRNVEAEYWRYEVTCGIFLAFLYVEEWHEFYFNVGNSECPGLLTRLRFSPSFILVMTWDPYKLKKERCQYKGRNTDTDKKFEDWKRRRKWNSGHIWRVVLWERRGDMYGSR